MARPRKTLDPQKVISLASESLTVEEIAASLDVSADTLTRNYAEQLEKGRRLCDRSLRKKQYQVAMAGDTRMLIHLGKNRLGQVDKSETEISGSMRIEFVSNIPLAE